MASVAGSLRYAAHQEREAGFLNVLEELFPKLTVVGLREGLDDTEKNYRQTRLRVPGLRACVDPQQPLTRKPM